MREFTSTTYTGDSTATSSPAGGSGLRTITDVFGRTVERREYAGAAPADTEYGAGVSAAYTSTKYVYTPDGKPGTVTGTDRAQWSYTYDLFGRQNSATDPDKGKTTTSYTNLDQVDTVTDSNSTLLYGYDELGRKTDEWQKSKTDANKLAHWAYDTLAKGQLDSSTNYVGGVSGTAYSQKVTAYDSLNRPTTTQLVLPSTDPLVSSGAVSATLAFSTYYNLDGTQQYIQEPAAGGLASEKISYNYDSVGLPTDASGLSGYLLGAAYSATGQTQQLTLGTSNAEGTKKAYITNTWEEGTDRLKQSAVTDQTHAYELSELNYSYDDAGNVTSITDPTTLGGTGKADNQCFAVDGHRRLTEAWTPAAADCSASGRTTANLGGAGPYWTSYSYADDGVRTTETAHTASSTTTNTYCYDSTKVHQLIATTTKSSCAGVVGTYGYNATGDITGRPNGTDTQSLTWNSRGRLDTLTEKSSSGSTKSTTSHIYDADGTLLIRRNTGGETVLYLDGVTEVHLDTSTSTAKYWAQRHYTAADSTIALRSSKPGGPTLSWLAADRHGTSSLAVDATNQAVTKRYTTPFGAPRAGGTGTWPDDKAFLGKATDPTSNLTYVGAREYDPVTGRFLSVDPLLDTGDAQSLNGYTYADNNPTTGSDPTGLRDCGETEYCGKGSQPNINWGSAASPSDTSNDADSGTGSGSGTNSGGGGNSNPTAVSGPASIYGGPAVDPYYELRQRAVAVWKALPGYCAKSPLWSFCGGGVASSPSGAENYRPDDLIIRWLLGEGPSRVVYGDDSVMSRYMAATTEAGEARAEAVTRWKTDHDKDLRSLASYSLAKMSGKEKAMHVVLDLMSLNNYRESNGGIVDVNSVRVALGSYKIRGRVLGADETGINVRFTVEETQSIHSAAHIVTGYRTGAEATAKGLDRQSGPMADVTHVITWKEVIPFDQ
ncbi:RHS repeat-associated core domain-containing protein [Streptomyces sp. NPDC059215]|uniref:RHS repeat-associated core domain-containing protein n=1 Tax=Streptomyces sp. NPDC059215 TaxID=3346772 RepID=UPI0036B4E41D